METHLECKHYWAPWGVCSDCGRSLMDIEREVKAKHEQTKQLELASNCATRKLRNLVRKHVGVCALNRYPILVVKDSTAAPKLTGHNWHYTTTTGKPIHHPSAYSKVGWSSMVYKSSTREIQVGALWLQKQVTNG